MATELMEQHLLVLLTCYGEQVLFFAQAFGILGLPIPGELLLTLAGSLVRRGDMRASSTVAAAIGGSLAGVTLGYPQTRRFESSWNAVLETGGFLVGDEVQIALSLQAVAESNRE